MSLPDDPKARKSIPLATGVLDYFADALIEVAKVSAAGNEQHHPGQPLHWDKSKSQDEADALMRHLIERGKLDTDGMRHSAKVAWRALALLQRELEAEDSTSKKALEKKPYSAFRSWITNPPTYIYQDTELEWYIKGDGTIQISKLSQFSPQFNVHNVWWRVKT